MGAALLPDQLDQLGTDRTLHPDLEAEAQGWETALGRLADTNAVCFRYDYLFASPRMKGKQSLWLDTIIKGHIKAEALKAGIHLKGCHTLRRMYSTFLKSNVDAMLCYRFVGAVRERQGRKRAGIGI